MSRWLIMFLLFSAIVFGCASDYKMLREATGIACDSVIVQTLETSWYRATVDVVGKHMSGLFLIKNMPDSSQRIVFTNEAGVKFFDFEYLKNNTFKVAYIMPQLDKKGVADLLRNDFALVLAIPFRTSKWQKLESADELYFGSEYNNKMFFMILDKECRSTHRFEYGSRKKRLVTVTLNGAEPVLPDSIAVQHHNFEMTVKLKRIAKS